MDYFFVLLFVGLAVALVGGGLAMSYMLAPHNPNKEKSRTYECGEHTVGPSWVHFNVGYYMVALLFLVFDVEAAFLFPWALAFRSVGLFALVEVAIFMLILLVALIYAWKKKALEWV